MKKFIKQFFVVILLFLSVLLNAQSNDKDISYFFLIDGTKTKQNNLFLQKTSVTSIVLQNELRTTIIQHYVNCDSKSLKAQYLLFVSPQITVHECKTISNDTFYSETNIPKQLLIEKLPKLWGMFCTNTLNIATGDTITALIEFSEKLNPKKNKYEICYPKAQFPVYTDNYTSVTQTTPYIFDIQATIKSIAEISEINCKTHKQFVEFANDNKTAYCTFEENKRKHSDFILKYKLSEPIYKPDTFDILPTCLQLENVVEKDVEKRIRKHSNYKGECNLDSIKTYFFRKNNNQSFYHFVEPWDNAIFEDFFLANFSQRLIDEGIYYYDFDVYLQALTHYKFSAPDNKNFSLDLYSLADDGSLKLEGRTFNEMKGKCYPYFDFICKKTGIYKIRILNRTKKPGAFYAIKYFKGKNRK